MNSENFFSHYFQEIDKMVQTIDQQVLIDCAEIIWSCKKAGGKVVVAGNGGSAAMASHISVDLTKAARVRSINFNEADLITCFSNDYGYENWVSEALKAFADPNDVIILISSSGSSPNILNAASYTKTMNVPLITLSGFNADNPLRKLGNKNLWVNSGSYNVIEMTHHIWLLSIIDFIIEVKY